jgi:ankyrin repeat protein
MQLGNAPLHSASSKGHSIVVARLIQAGANADQACQLGLTPLQLASDGGHVGVVNALLRARQPARLDLTLDAVRYTGECDMVCSPLLSSALLSSPLL